MMKSLKVLSMVAVASMAAVPCARAADVVKVDVPFNFVVAGQQFPGGEYLFVRGEDHRIVQVCSKDRLHFAVAVGLAEPNATRDTGLVFHKHGEQYFLKAVSGNGLDFALPTTQAEKVAEAAQGDGRAVAVGTR